VNRVVFEQVSHIIGVAERVVYGGHFYIAAPFGQTQRVAPDATESVDANFHIYAHPSR
jgi:hypothetical protein